MSNAAAAAEAPPAAKGKKKLIIIIAAAVLLLGGGGTAALLLMKKKHADEDAGDETAQVEKAKPKAAKHDPKAVPTFVQLDPFTVNLADRETERYAQIALTLEVDDPSTGERIKSFMPAVRNNILMVLAHKTSEQMLEREGKSQLATEIRRETSRALGVEVDDEDEEAADDSASKKKKKKKRKPEVVLPVVAVHFSNFIVQ